MFATDSSSERATSIEDYQNTCTQFIIDISKDYKDWVDRYQLSVDESESRKSMIDNIVTVTNNWIFNYANNIKKVDIVMNDGVTKMAETTAGYPFQFEVSVNEMNRYVFHPAGKIRLRVKATPKEGLLVRIGNYNKDQLFLINSTSIVNFAVSKDSLEAADVLDDYVIIDSTDCQRSDLLSVTIVAQEINKQGNAILESRGYSTLILLT